MLADDVITNNGCVLTSRLTAMLLLREEPGETRPCGALYFSAAGRSCPIPRTHHVAAAPVASSRYRGDSQYFSAAFTHRSVHSLS